MVLGVSLRSLRAGLKTFKHPYVVNGVPFDKGQMPPVGGGDAQGSAGCQPAGGEGRSGPVGQRGRAFGPQPTSSKTILFRMVKILVVPAAPPMNLASSTGS